LEALFLGDAHPDEYVNNVQGAHAGDFQSGQLNEDLQQHWGCTVVRTHGLGAARTHPGRKTGTETTRRKKRRGEQLI
jgi:hypothetical protein